MSNWEKLAKDNAEYYILTHEGIDYGSEQGQAYFYQSGEKFTQNTLQNVSDHLFTKNKCLEIGCGIGRLSFAHSKVFEEVYAVDISQTMLDKLKASALKKNVNNIKPFLSHESWDDPDKFDYVYSFIVFQHIKDFGIIESYIERISNCISPSGIIQIQFDTRKATLLYQIRNILPDLFLPKSQRKGIRRIRRKSEKLKSIFKKYNLKIIDELQPDSAQHTFILRR